MKTLLTLAAAAALIALAACSEKKADSANAAFDTNTTSSNTAIPAQPDPGLPTNSAGGATKE